MLEQELAAFCVHSHAQPFLAIHPCSLQGYPWWMELQESRAGSGQSHTCCSTRLWEAAWNSGSLGSVGLLPQIELEPEFPVPGSAQSRH